MTKAVDPPSSPAQSSTPPLKVGITLHEQEYIVACDPSEEKKLAELVLLVDKKLTEVASRSVNPSETRLFMLTCLLLADELVETRKLITENHKIDEALILAAVEHLSGRIKSIAEQLDAVGP